MLNSAIKFNTTANKLHNSLRKIQTNTQNLLAWRAARFDRALVRIEDVFLNVPQNGRASLKQSYDASKELVRIIVYHTDFYFLLGGMTLMVFATRSFTEPGIDYGPWRPVVVTLAALLAAIIPLFTIVILYPIHLMLRGKTWPLTVLNIVISAHIFAVLEPAIPSYFYNDGVLSYRDLIYGIFVFYALALGYLHLRLNQFYSYNSYQQRHRLRDLISFIPADKRGKIYTVSAQDHYVEIVTENGAHKTRMSMKDAMAMLPADQGIQVHRSHWVSFNAMLSLDKSTDRYFLTLRNGQKMPVSKSNIKAVERLLELRKI